MPLQIDIPDEQLEYLSEHARNEFIDSTKKYVEELIDESSRLESAGRSDNDAPEITATMVKDAALHLKRYPHPQKKKRGQTAVQVISYISTLFTGILFNIKEFQSDAVSLIIFLIVLAIAITTTTIDFTQGRK